MPWRNRRAVHSYTIDAAGTDSYTVFSVSCFSLVPPLGYTRLAEQRVLVADDSSDIRAILQEVLVFAGYSVITVADGAEAVEQCQKHRPDLILMDLMMPVMDGWEATHRLKAASETADIPIIAVSAMQESQIAAELRSTGFYSFVGKPASARHLLDVVGRCLADREARRCVR